MVGELIKKIYKYNNVILESGAIVTANEVIVQDNKITSIANGTANIKIGNNERILNFNIYNHGPNNEKIYNINNIPENISGEAIIKEFITFVENDIIYNS